MRKTFTLLIALLALCVSSWATVTQQQIGSFYYELDDETHTATLIKDPNAANEWVSYSVSGDLVIPGTVNDGVDDYTVTTIGEKAFINGNMSSIVIEEGVVNIAENAFLFCSNYLTKATLPSTIESIGNYAFQSSGLTKITINATTPPTLGYDVFENASSLAHIYVPSASVNAYKTAWSDHASIIDVAPVTVEWNQAKVASVYVYMSSGYADPQSQTIDDAIIVTANAPESGDYSQFSTYVDDVYHTSNTSISLENGGTMTFAPTSGKLKSIVIECGYKDPSLSVAGSGWTWNAIDEYSGQLIWTSATEEGASSVVLASNGSSFYFGSISSVEFIFVAEEEQAPADPANQEPVTWDFVNDAELASIYLRQYTHYNFNGYYSEYYDSHYEETVKNFKGIVATISAMTEGSYACFSNQNNYSIDLENGGTLTFSTELGQFKSIVINTNGNGSGSGEWAWSIEEHTLTWAGTPANLVVLDNIDISNITSIVFTFVSAAPAFTADITWDATEVATISLYGSSFNTVVSGSEIDGITPSIMKTNDGYCYFDNSKIKMQNNGELIFTSSVGDIQGIVLAFDNTDSYSISDFPVGWTLDEGAGTLTWTGTAAEEVSLSGKISCTVTSIGFDVDPSTAPLIPTGPNFEWQWRQVNLVELYCTGLNEVQKTNVIKNVITALQRTVVNSDYCYFQNGSIKLVDNGELTFKSIVGDFTGIVITGSAYTTPTNLPANWTYNSTAGTITWMGTPAEEVTLSGDIDINNISSIKFFYDPEDAPYVGTKFFGIRDQWYEITGAHTAKMPVQTINHTLDVPASVEYENETYYVTEIADNAFKNNVDLPNVYIGANVARIGAHAFEGCYRMDEVTVNSTVLESIGDEAFKNCQLMHIFECSTNLPPELGSNVFYGDTRINHYNVLSSYVVDRYKAADGWSALADKIYLMFGEPDLGEVFFWNNQMTTNLYAVVAVSPEHEAKVLPYTVNDLYPRTLSGRLTIPEEVRYMNKDYDVAVIGADAYKDATLIDFVLIPQAVKTIEAGAFSGCTGVTNVQFLWNDPTSITWADRSVGAEFATAVSGNTKIFVPKGKLAVYQTWAPAWASCMVEGELLDIDVTDSQDPDHAGRYYRTFYDSQTDYLMPPSVWAHAGYVDGENFILRPVAFDGQILPRNTAVVLESETPTYRLIPMGNTAPLYTGPNDLIGTDVNILRTSVGNNGENVYVLGKQATVGGDLRVGMGMYRYTGTNLGAHKAYMILNSSTPNPAPRYLFKHENQAEGVENVQNNASCNKILRDGQLIIVKGDREYNAQGLIIK